MKEKAPDEWDEEQDAGTRGPEPERLNTKLTPEELARRGASTYPIGDRVVRPPMSQLVPSSANTYSKAPDRWPKNAPRRITGALGAWVACDDGNTYVDCTSALGPILLGHRWGASEQRLGPIEQAAILQIGMGVSLSLPTEVEAKLAWKLVGLVPGAEMCRFGKNGNDVVNAAVRLARAHTGKKHILRYCYSGHADWAVEAPMNAGVPSETLGLTHRIRTADLDDLERHLRYLDVAALVAEPIPTHEPHEPTPEFMRSVRELCDRYGALWIMDEMVTGFRCGYPGAVANYDVVPDLWCGAKALGGGWPITALLGPAEIMKRLEQDVFYSTTFAGEAVSIAAALASLNEMERVDALGTVMRLGNQIHTTYACHVLATGLENETSVIGYPSRPVFKWKHDDLKAVFLETMVEHGVLCQGYINVMCAHEETMGRLDTAIAAGLNAVRTRLNRDAEVRVA